MPIGGADLETKRRAHAGKMTAYLFLACLFASTGGLLFGYDVGVSGDN